MFCAGEKGGKSLIYVYGKYFYATLATRTGYKSVKQQVMEILALILFTLTQFDLCLKLSGCS